MNNFFRTSLLLTCSFVAHADVPSDDAIHESNTETTNLRSEVHPISSIPVDSTRQCYSTEQHTKLPFANIGSLCVDGLYSLMWGRGCPLIVGTHDPSSRWTYQKCETQPTCDQLHNDTFAIVPVGISIEAEFDADVEFWCQDNNYVVLKI
jgi:hypothetical protein